MNKIPTTARKTKLPRKRPSLLPVFNTSIITPRLMLRRIDMRDAQVFADAMGDADGAMLSFFEFPPHCDDVDVMRDSIIPVMREYERSIGYFYLGAFKIGAPDKMMGMVLCKYDINNLVRVSYFVKPSQRRKQYGQEIYGHLMQVIKARTGQRMMVAEVAPDNTASQRMLFGMGFEAHGLRYSTQNRPSKDATRYVAFRKVI